MSASLPAAPLAERVLVVEDALSDFLLLQRQLQRAGHGRICRQVASAEALEAALAEGSWQVVLVDHTLPGVAFETMLARLRAALPDVPVILVSGTIGEELAVDLLHQGVADFVLKDRLARLVPAIERCVGDVQRRRAAAEAARALADSEAFNRTIVGSLGDGLFIAQDRRFVFANPALPALLGHTHEVFVGMPFEAVVAPESLPVWNERFDQRVLPELPEPERHYDVAFVHADGHYVWMELRAARFHYQGRPAVLGLLRDMTERRRILAELHKHREHLEVLVEERTHKAEAASRAKTSFLANMSHEIRTPLNAITGMVYLLKRDAPDDFARKRLDTVEGAARHLLSLVDDVLDLSKIESGKLVLEQIDFDLDALLTRTCAMLAERARDKGLALGVENHAAGARLRGDPTRLSQVLLNLVGNAVKFTEQGSVQVVCSLQGDDTGAPLLRLEVRDTGPGIEPARVARLFTAFEQGDNSTTRRFGGTGLGLAITRHLVELMGGQVGVESGAGGGSVFWFTARLQPARDPAGSAEVVPQPRVDEAERSLRHEYAGARVLLAEDNAVNQMVAGELLRGAGLEVDLADDGLQAVERARQRPYALILMDVQMPQLDGLQAARAIRRLPGLDAVPIVAMTANAFSEDRDACLAAGMDDHITKPVMPQRLYQTLLHWLRQTAPPSSDGPPQTLPVAEADAEAPALLATLAALPGLQAQAGLAQFSGRAGAYRRALRHWADTYARGLPGTESGALADGGAQLRFQLHALHGAAAALGAAPLAAQAQALEAYIGTRGSYDPATLRQRLAALQADVAALARGLHAALPAD